MALPPLIRPAVITPYLACTDIVDCTSESVRRTAREETIDASDDIEEAERLFRYVRDSIAHSVDFGRSELVWRASEVLRSGHALCFGKSHLLVALCRSLGIPAGFCYQRVMSGERMLLHGLCAVYLEQLDRWIRLDARGNKPGIKVEFSLDDDAIAYAVHGGTEEWLDRHVYPEPWKSIIYLYETSPDTAVLIDRSSRIKRPDLSSFAHHGTELSTAYL